MSKKPTMLNFAFKRLGRIKGVPKMTQQIGKKIVFKNPCDM